MSQMGSTMLGEFISLDALEPVDDEDVQEGRPSSPPPGSGGVKDGKAYGVPWYVDTRALYYRTDLAEKAGVKEPPATWEDQQQARRGVQGQGEDQVGHLQPARQHRRLADLASLPLLRRR